MLDINKIREDYPILQRQIEGRPLIYLDNAATSQTPRPVVEAINQMYYHYKANVHRGVHTLSQEATDLVEQTREKVSPAAPPRASTWWPRRSGRCWKMVTKSLSP